MGVDRWVEFQTKAIVSNIDRQCSLPILLFDFLIDLGLKILGQSLKFNTAQNYY